MQTTPSDNTACDADLSGIRHFLRLSPRLATAGQPTAEQFASIAAAGFECVVNLALPTSTDALSDEAEVVAALGMEYVPIPVVWESPQFRDFARFAKVLQERAAQPVFVHCAMNMRVSAFMFLHRTLVEGRPRMDAMRDLNQIWEPDETWCAFLSSVSSHWYANHQTAFGSISKGAHSLRPMKAGDLPAVITLWRQTPGVGLSPDEAEPMLQRYLERNPDLSKVALGANGTIVGAILAGHDGRRGFLYHLAVAPSHRGLGLGRALAEAGVAGLRTCGVARVSIMVFATNAEGRAFWEHLGWKGRDDLRALQIVF